jgi:hypothetical protein
VKVFISWSGDLSKQVASRLHEWLRSVFVDVDPWISNRDILPGSRWASDLGAELSEAKFGILCLTTDNLRNPWLLFEAGAISKHLADTRLVPYRFGIHDVDVEPPLSQFQSVSADEAGTLDLVRSINAARDRPIESSRLEKIFAQWWPSLAQQLGDITNAKSAVSAKVAAPVRTDRELLEEMLGDLRRSLHQSQESQKRSDARFAALVLLHEGSSIADLVGKGFDDEVVEWSKLATNPEAILPGLELHDVTRLANRGFKLPNKLRDLLSSMSGDLGSPDPRDLGWIQSTVSNAGALASPYLLKAAAVSDSVQRGHAAYLLGWTGDPNVVATLIPLLSDSAPVGIVPWLPTVAAAARLALERIGSPEALAALERTPKGSS